MKIPALPPVLRPIREPREVIPPPPGSVPVPSLIMTSQNWPIVRAPVPESPRFGIAYGDELRSLPAFVVPLALRRAARAVAMVAPESPDVSREPGVAPVLAGNDARSSDPLGDLAWIHGELTQSRRRSALLALGAVVFVFVAVLLTALLR